MSGRPEPGDYNRLNGKGYIKDFTRGAVYLAVGHL